MLTSTLRRTMSAAIIILPSVASGRMATRLHAQEPPVVYASLADNAAKDCKSIPAPVPCRVRKTDPLQSIEARLARNENAWNGGDVINFAFNFPGRSDSGGPILTGGLQAPMSRITGTDIWVLSMYVPQLERASLSYAVVNPNPTGVMMAIAGPLTWTGPKAPADPVLPRVMQGRMEATDLESPLLKEKRRVNVYVPPARGQEPIHTVIFMTDGGNVKNYALVIDTLIAEGKLPRVLLVGASSARNDPTNPGIRDARTAEYVIGMDSIPDRFLAHETFFTTTLRQWAEVTFGAPAQRERRIVGGASAGAAFALQMGLRHPDLYGHVIAYSPARIRPNLSAGSPPAMKTSFYLWGGLLEPEFHSNGKAWAAALAATGLPATFADAVNGHDLAAWTREFPEAIRWSLKN